jgi:hypothetical protein
MKMDQNRELSMRMVFCFLFLGIALAHGDRVDVLAINPQKTFEFQRRQAKGLDGGDPQFVDFVDLKSGKIVFSFSSVWRSTDGGWSPDGLSACVNDRTANSGDALYIFRFIDGHLTLLRAPGDDGLLGRLDELYNKLHSTGRFTLTCHDWLDNDSFVARVTGGGHGDDQSFDVRVTIDSAGQFHVDAKSQTMLR